MQISIPPVIPPAMMPLMNLLFPDDPDGAAEAATTFLKGIMEFDNRLSFCHI